MNKFTWPFVAVVFVGCASVVGILVLIPANMPEARSALLGVITAAVGAIVTAAVASIGHQVDRTNDKVDQLTRQTNGHMSSLIAAKTQPDVVSRETPPPAQEEP